MSNNKKRTLIIGFSIICSVFAVLSVIYAVFGFDFLKSEDLDFIDKVSNEAISANILLIRATDETASEGMTSTSYSVGHSGVVFKREDNKYYVLTALHAIELDNPKMFVLRYNQPTYNEYVKNNNYTSISAYYSQFPETVIEYYDKTYDLAVISFVSELEFTVLSIAPEPPKYNEPVAAIGSPHENERNAITTGNITSRNPVPFGDEAGRSQHNVITHSAKISDGSSGGALLNENLKIVGINLGGSHNFFRFIEGKAMPSDRILEFLSVMD